MLLVLLEPLRKVIVKSMLALPGFTASTSSSEVSLPSAPWSRRQKSSSLACASTVVFMLECPLWQAYFWVLCRLSFVFVRGVVVKFANRLL